MIDFESSLYVSKFKTKHDTQNHNVHLAKHDIHVYIYIYTTSEKPVNDQSYGVLDRYGITILYK